MYDESQTSHIRRLCLIEYNEIQELKKRQSKRKRKELAFYYSMVAIMVSVVAQYVIDVVFKILRGENFKKWFKVTYPWQSYYAVVIASAFIGILKAYLPPKLLSISAVILTTIVYQTIAKITGLTTLTSEELIESIIADIFIVQLILYIYERLTSNKKNKKQENKEITSIGDIFVITLSTSLVINIASFLSKNAYNTLFNFGSSNTRSNVLIDDD